MQHVNVPAVITEKTEITSAFLERDVRVDFYLPKNISRPDHLPLLLINDGQDLPKFRFDEMLSTLIRNKVIEPLVCAGIHCGVERKMEYGTAGITDFMGRGAKAGLHKRFVLEELLPYLRRHFGLKKFREKSYAGFSLGGLTAIDVVWHHPDEFKKAGIFSGSLWWRLKDLDDGYIEETDRIIHKLIREGRYAPGLRFFFTTGSLDETMDRNNNGIIDSIDDTLGLIDELQQKGYAIPEDIFYINYKDGKHDVETWGRAMPEFLRWGWGL